MAARQESLENILNIVIRPEFVDWQVLRHDGKREPFDPLRLFQSFLESGMDLQSAVRLFDRVVEDVHRIAQIDVITQDRIHDTVVDALIETTGRDAQVWLANYTSIFGAEHENGNAAPDYVNVRQKGELKRRVLLYLCDAYSVEDEAQVRALLGDDEFTLLTEQLIKVVRYCGFYRVRKDFLDSLLTELSERSVKSIIPSKKFDPESASSQLRDIGQRIVLARDESQTNKTAGLNILTTAAEDMAAILLRRFGVITRRNTMGSLRQLADLLGTVSSADDIDGRLASTGFRARTFPNLDRIAGDLKKALELHRRPVKQFWMACEELREAIEGKHILRACRCAEDILASAKLIVSPDKYIATLVTYDHSKAPVTEYLEAFATVLSNRNFAAYRSAAGDYVDLECDFDEHPLLDLGRVLRVRAAFAGDDWDIEAHWKRRCLNDAQESDEIVPVLVTNRKLSLPLIASLQDELRGMGRYMAIIESKSIEEVLYRPERIRDLVLSAIIPTDARSASTEIRKYDLPSGIGVGYEREFLTSALALADDEKGESAARNTGVFLESAIREHFCFAYGIMLSRKGGVPIELRIANGQWDGRPFWGIRSYLSWFRAAGDIAKRNTSVASVAAVLPSRRALTDLSDLQPSRNAYAHRTREVPRPEAKAFIERVARAVEPLVSAKGERDRGIVVGNEGSITLHTETGVQTTQWPANRKPLGIGALVYFNAETQSLTPHLIVQCEECHTVAPLPAGRKNNAFICSTCRHQNFLEGMWGAVLKKGDAQITQMLRPQKLAWRPPENPKVFISYASEQEGLAQEIGLVLEKRHVTVWLYQDMIVPGDPLIESLSKGLNSANHGVFLISREFLGKSWPRAELDVLLHKFIESRSVRLIPVLIGVEHAELAEAIPLMRGIVSVPFTSSQEISRRIASIVFKPAGPPSRPPA